MISRLQGIAVAAVLAVSLPLLPAHAKSLKASGTSSYVPVNSDVTPLSEEANLLRTQSRAILMADDPTLPFHLSNQDCAGTYLLDANGQVDTGRGYCDIIDADDGTWEVMGGTGKYEGMTGTGTSKVLSQATDGRFAVRWEGTWEMK